MAKLLPGLALFVASIEIARGNLIWVALSVVALCLVLGALATVCGLFGPILRDG